MIFVNGKTREEFEGLVNQVINKQGVDYLKKIMNNIFKTIEQEINIVKNRIENKQTFKQSIAYVWEVTSLKELNERLVAFEEEYNYLKSIYNRY